MENLATRDIRTEEMLLNMGPQHPSTHGVFRVVIRTDGEMILESESHVGYLHRCFEKCAEGNNYIQVVPYTDRMDYLCAIGNNLGYSQAVEKLMGLQVPERAEYIRVMTLELNRIASHLIAFGTYGLDLGAITPFLYAWRDREKILKIFEKLCGQRLNYSYVRVGGVTFDMTDEILGDILAFCDGFDPELIDEYDALLSYNGIFISRTANVGVLPLDVAISHGVTLDNTEVETLKEWILKSISPYADEKREHLKVLYHGAMKDAHSLAKNGELNLSEHTRELNEIAEQATRYETIELCFDVMAADSVVDTEELKVINRVADALDLDFDEIEKMRDQVIINLGANVD